jgi:ATPase subunit of ABC transporter with duplicated ATPase domains
MESIESLNTALENYPGTLLFVSHDREFVSSLATRIIELTPKGVVNFSGSYEDYLQSQGVEQASLRQIRQGAEPRSTGQMTQI